MKKRLIRIFNGTSFVALLDETECEATVTRKINSDWSISLTYKEPRNGSKAEYFQEDYRLYVVDADDFDDYHDFIITDIQKQRTAGGAATYVVSGQHHSIITMSREIIAGFYEFRGETPTNILAIIMGFSAYSAGAVTPAAKVDLTIGYETVLSALQKLIKVTNAYYDVTESPRTVLIKTALGSNKFVRIQADTNLRSLSLVNHTAEVRNRVYGVGGGQPPVTIGGAPHTVLAIQGAGVQIKCSDNKVVPTNDVYNTNYSVKFLTGALAGNAYQITDCSHASDYDLITVASSVASAAKWDLFKIITTAGVEVESIFSGAGNKHTVYQNSQWQDIVNYLKVPALDGTYSSGLCEEWTKEGSPTVSENTTATYIKYGQKSQRVQTTSNAEGVKQTIASDKSNETWSFVANVYLATGSVMLALQAGTTGYVIAATTTGQWATLKLENILVSGASVTVYILSATATSDFYVDSVQASVSKEVQRFANPSDKKSLWNETFDKHAEVSTGRVTYQAQFADLYRISPANYPFYEVALGDTVRVLDEGLAIDEALMVVEQRDPIFRPEKMESIISNE